MPLLRHPLNYASLVVKSEMIPAMISIGNAIYISPPATRAIKNSGNKIIPKTNLPIPQAALIANHAIFAMKTIRNIENNVIILKPPFITPPLL